MWFSSLLVNIKTSVFFIHIKIWFKYNYLKCRLIQINSLSTVQVHIWYNQTQLFFSRARAFLSSLTNITAVSQTNNVSSVQRCCTAYEECLPSASTDLCTSIIQDKRSLFSDVRSVLQYDEWCITFNIQIRCLDVWAGNLIYVNIM